MITSLLSFYVGSALLGTPAELPPSVISNEKSAIRSETPTRNYQNIAPVINAKSAIAVDLKTGLVLFEKNSQQKLPIASITKLMTTIVILENHQLDEIMTVSQKASEIEGSKLWLTPGEKLTVKSLLTAALIHSANDAAYTLAENDSATLQDFLAKMNQKAEELGLYSTRFQNPVGLDEKGNYSTAYDLTILSRYAYEKDFIRQTVGKKEAKITSTDGKLQHEIKTTNELLSSYLKVLGLKTGTTDEAGQCLIAIIENDQGHDILTVILGSESRFQETKILADWVFRTYKWNTEFRI